VRVTPPAPKAKRDSPEKGEGGEMTRKYIPVEEVAKKWLKDPDFVTAYDARGGSSLWLQL
jgi:hypothetical protein